MSKTLDSTVAVTNCVKLGWTLKNTCGSRSNPATWTSSPRYCAPNMIASPSPSGAPYLVLSPLLLPSPSPPSSSQPPLAWPLIFEICESSATRLLPVAKSSCCEHFVGWVTVGTDSLSLIPSIYSPFFLPCYPDPLSLSSFISPSYSLALRPPSQSHQFFLVTVIVCLTFPLISFFLSFSITLSLSLILSLTYPCRPIEWPQYSVTFKAWTPASHDFLYAMLVSSS